MTGVERLRMTAEIHRGNGNTFMATYLSDIADQIEREHDAEVADSPYDAILPEDSDAITWVREHGGLEKVKLDALCWNTAENVAQTTLDWLARVCPVAGIEKCGYGVSLEKLEDAINRRLMPEGYEWPRYESGEPVRIGDDYECWCGETHAVCSVTIREGRSALNESHPHTFVVSNGPFTAHGKRVRRPAVLASDGESLEVGQTVWETDAEADTPLTVIEVSSDLVRCEYTWKDGKTYRPCYPPDQLTHQRPVLGADGVPIETCQKMWRVRNGEEVRVSQIDRGEYPLITYIGEDGLTHEITPDGLTHTKPEPKRICGDCRHWQGDPSASHMGVCFNSYRERCCVDSYAAQLDYAKACEDFEERGE